MANANASLRAYTATPNSPPARAVVPLKATSTRYSSGRPLGFEGKDLDTISNMAPSAVPDTPAAPGAAGPTNPGGDPGGTAGDPGNPGDLGTPGASLGGAAAVDHTNSGDDEVAQNNGAVNGGTNGGRVGSVIGGVLGTLTGVPLASTLGSKLGESIGYGMGDSAPGGGFAPGGQSAGAGQSNAEMSNDDSASGLESVTGGSVGNSASEVFGGNSVGSAVDPGTGVEMGGAPGDFGGGQGPEAAGGGMSGAGSSGGEMSGETGSGEAGGGETGGGGCFITEAVMSSGGQDSGDELNTLRQFRDSVLASTPQGQALIAEYNAIAPVVVDAVMQREDSLQIFQNLDAEYIMPAVAAVKAGDMKKALQIYAQMIAFVTPLAAEAGGDDGALNGGDTGDLDNFGAHAAGMAYDDSAAMDAVGSDPMNDSDPNGYDGGPDGSQPLGAQQGGMPGMGSSMSGGGGMPPPTGVAGGQAFQQTFAQRPRF